MGRQQGFIHDLTQFVSDEQKNHGEVSGGFCRKLKAIDKRLDSGDIENEIQELAIRHDVINEDIVQLKAKQEFTFGDQTSFDESMAAYEAEMQELFKRTTELEQEKETLFIDKKLIRTFLDAFEAMPDKLTHFNGKHFINTIDRVIVDQSTLIYHFYGGESIKVKIEDMKKMCL